MRKTDKIISDIKKGPVKVFFDMDGVIAEYDFIVGGISNKVGIYSNKRPINTTIKFTEKLHHLGAEVYILSLCNYNFQKEEKLLWLEKHLPFLKPQNIYVIPKKESEFASKEKSVQKPEFIREHISETDTVYFIDDTGDILTGMHKVLPFVNCVHVSELID